MKTCVIFLRKSFISALQLFSNLHRSCRHKAGSHVRRKRKRKRKRKHKEVHTSNANASTVQYASAMEYSKMVDEIDALVLLFFLFLGLRRIRRRRLIQRNNKSRPKRLWRNLSKKTTFSFLVAAQTVLKTNF